MVADFSGKWELEASENFEQYLDALKLKGEMKAKLVGSTPSFTITQDGENLKVVYANGRTLNLSPGTEFEQELPNGMTVKGTPAWSGSKLVVTVKVPDVDKEHITTREIIGGKFVQIFEFGGVTAKRTFKKA